MPDTLESKIDTLAVRFADVSGAVSSFSEKLDDVRLKQAKMATWCEIHDRMHLSIAADIAGIEGREREATGRVDPVRRSDSDAPRKGVRIDLRSLSLRDVVFVLALVASLALGGSAALSGDGDEELRAAMRKAVLEAVAAATPPPSPAPEEVEP